MEDKHRATIWRQSLREHCQLDDRQWQWQARPHWLLSSRIGRIALLLKLRKVRPTALSAWRDQARIDPLLDAMVDELRLRGLDKPISARAKMLDVLYALVQVHRSEQRQCGAGSTAARRA